MLDILGDYLIPQFRIKRFFTFFCALSIKSQSIKICEKFIKAWNEIDSKNKAHVKKSASTIELFRI